MYKISFKISPPWLSHFYLTGHWHSSPNIFELPLPSRLSVPTQVFNTIPKLRTIIYKGQQALMLDLWICSGQLSDILTRCPYSNGVWAWAVVQKCSNQCLPLLIYSDANRMNEVQFRRFINIDSACFKRQYPYQVLTSKVCSTFIKAQVDTQTSGAI